MELDNEPLFKTYLVAATGSNDDWEPYVLQGFTPELYEWPDTPTPEYQGYNFQSLITTFVRGVILGLAALKVIDLISVIF